MTCRQHWCQHDSGKKRQNHLRSLLIISLISSKLLPVHKRRAFLRISVTHSEQQCGLDKYFHGLKNKTNSLYWQISFERDFFLSTIPGLGRLGSTPDLNKTLTNLGFSILTAQPRSVCPSKPATGLLIQWSGWNFSPSFRFRVSASPLTTSVNKASWSFWRQASAFAYNLTHKLSSFYW